MVALLFDNKSLKKLIVPLIIEQFLAVRPDTGLVVIDTLQKVRIGDANGNVYACDYRDMSALKSLADRHNIGILLVIIVLNLLLNKLTKGNFSI